MGRLYEVLDKVSANYLSLPSSSDPPQPGEITDEMVKRVAAAIRDGLGPVYDPDFESAAREAIETTRSFFVAARSLPL